MIREDSPGKFISAIYGYITDKKELCPFIKVEEGVSDHAKIKRRKRWGRKKEL